MNHNENSKTTWFLAAAALMVAVAWFTRPVEAVKGEAAVLNTKLFADFKDPVEVDSLQILQYDQEHGKSRDLTVAKQNNVWAIPSHGNYPADAKEHLAAAANSLIDLTIVGLAPGFDAGSPALNLEALHEAHNRYGVVEPDSKSIKSSDTGIGTRVTMKDAAGHQLASVVIGKPVPEQTDLYYVRKADKDPVYIVKLDASKLSVKFEDWIEPNLLNLNTMDLKKVEIKDYAFTITAVPVSKNSNQMELAPVKTFKGEFALDAPSGDQPWKLVQDMAFDGEKIIPRPLAADEEVNTANLDALKSAFEDLKIVDVERKPAAVPADLRVRKLDEDTVGTLEERGFFVVPVSDDPDGPLEILSNSGDISLQLADGARYVLRFGKTTGESSAAEKAKKQKKGVKESESADKAKEDSSLGENRYLFVAADFKQDAIPKPVFDKLPEVKPAEKAAEKPAEKKTEAKDAKPADGDKKGPVKTGDLKDVKTDEPKKDDVKKDAAAKTEEVKKDEPKKDQPAKDEAKKDVKEPQPTPEALAAQRKQIETENKRRQEEYDAKVAAGKKHAKELSDRFAQWYYVIPGQTYAKIHLDRKQIVKKKEPPKDAAHDHDHEHEHGGFDAMPPSPAGTLEQLKKDAPAAPEKK